MDQTQQPQSGSFMANVGGGGSAIAQAMARRGMGGGETNQIGNGTPAGTNSVLPTPASTMPAPPQPGGMVPSSMQPPQQDNSQQGGNPEAQQILRSMDSYLKGITKLQHAQAGIQQ